MLPAVHAASSAPLLSFRPAHHVGAGLMPPDVQFVLTMLGAMALRRCIQAVNSVASHSVAAGHLQTSHLASDT